jgi:GNAT superfamily N-acetyltransferase
VRTTALRDGTRVGVRPLRPDDEALLAETFAHMSEESRYRRFMSPVPTLAPRVLHYLCCVDHHDHEALAAVAPETGEIVGEARYIRCRDRPEVAEIAVAVADEWQGRGVGSLLLLRLAGRARREGIERFSAFMLAGNQEMLELLSHVGPVERVGLDGPGLQVEAPVRRRSRPRSSARKDRTSAPGSGMTPASDRNPTVTPPR